ncbi:MAG: hypothetical protein JWM78_1029 [Verrucomicrobiaceae bacterium]|nr:hypothetical protein [Verrucomicrobiaceae bacterium]
MSNLLRFDESSLRKRSEFSYSPEVLAESNFGEFGTVAGTTAGTMTESDAESDIGSVKQLYRDLLDRDHFNHESRDENFRGLLEHSHADENNATRLKQRARVFIERQLGELQTIDDDFPRDPTLLATWINNNAIAVGAQYQNYLMARRQGSRKRFFTNKSHALHFLNAVAPTKLVDGAWLYGLLRDWKNPGLAPLIEIYLEELGDGIAGKNHVVLFKKLLETHGCGSNGQLADKYFTQGAVQLALAENAEEFFPEVLGFNLGYEQLPLHLLISAYELKELGIDPYYFTLHVTIDNPHSGHAQMALQGLLDLLPRVANPQAFYRRVINGYKLSMAGESTTAIIESFNLEKSLVAMLIEKSKVGKYMHSDRCHIGGRTMSEWLNNPQQIHSFLKSMVDNGWIKRNQNPQNSRFWQLLQGDKPAMFGVFTRAEEQLIYDWIAGDYKIAIVSEGRPSTESRINDARSKETRISQTPVHGAAAHKFGFRSSDESASRHTADLNDDLAQLVQRLQDLPDDVAAMNYLLPLLSPAQHHTPAGLAATEIFSRRFRQAGIYGLN